MKRSHSAAMAGKNLIDRLLVQTEHFGIADDTDDRQPGGSIIKTDASANWIFTFPAMTRQGLIYYGDFLSGRVVGISKEPSLHQRDTHGLKIIG